MSNKIIKIRYPSLIYKNRYLRSHFLIWKRAKSNMLFVRSSQTRMYTVTLYLRDLTAWPTSLFSRLDICMHLGSPSVFEMGSCCSSFQFSVLFCILFVLVLCLVCLMLPVSQYCLCMLVPSVISNVYSQHENKPIYIYIA